MTRSSDEQEIRDAVVVKLCEFFPDARIIHEMNVGHGKNRIDVAAVTPMMIYAVEIKSEKDTLKRLSDQLSAFTQCCHSVVVAAHEKFFDHFQYDDGSNGFTESEALRQIIRKCPAHVSTWCYPIPEQEGLLSEINAWKLRDFWPRLPDTRELMILLWTSELRVMAGRLGMEVKGLNQISGTKLREIMWHQLTGHQITKEVCAALRAREFAEADAPIPLPETQPEQTAIL
jgi:hypothetical protein